MAKSFEVEPAPKNSMKQYMDEMHDLWKAGDWNQLEEHFMKEHPTSPTEREVFLELEENLGREPRVELDETGMHVVPIESIADEDEKD